MLTTLELSTLCKMKLKYLYFVISIILLAVLVSAVIWSPQGNVDLKKLYNVTNGSYIFTDYYANSSGALEWIGPSNIFDVDDADIETDLNTYVDIAGDTMTGNLTIQGTSFNLSSTDAIFDLYGKNTLLESVASTGGIRITQSVGEAKGGIWWKAYDLATNQITTATWLNTHWNNTAGDVHSHFSIETLDNSTGTPSINSHFAITYNGSQPKAKITFPDSLVTIADLDSISSTATSITIKPYTTFAVYPNNQLTNALSVSNTSSAIVISALGLNYLQMQDHVEIVGNRMLILIANTTAYTCNSTYAGSVYYNGGTKKHYGCNSTTWNALY